MPKETKFGAQDIRIETRKKAMKAQFRSEFSHIHEKILEVKLKNT